MAETLRREEKKQTATNERKITLKSNVRAIRIRHTNEFEAFLRCEYIAYCVDATVRRAGRKRTNESVATVENADCEASEKKAARTDSRSNSSGNGNGGSPFVRAFHQNRKVMPWRLRVFSYLPRLIDDGVHQMCDGSVIDVADERERGNTWTRVHARVIILRLYSLCIKHSAYFTIGEHLTFESTAVAAAAETVQTTIPTHGTAMPPKPLEAMCNAHNRDNQRVNMDERSIAKAEKY